MSKPIQSYQIYFMTLHPPNLSWENTPAFYINGVSVLEKGDRRLVALVRSFLHEFRITEYAVLINVTVF